MSVDVGSIIVSPDASIEEHEAKLESLMERHTDRDNMWRCTFCGQNRNKRGDMVRHIETDMEELTFPCNQCGKISRCKKNTQYYISKVTKNRVAYFQECKWSPESCSKAASAEVKFV